MVDVIDETSKRIAFKLVNNYSINLIDTFCLIIF